MKFLVDTDRRRLVVGQGEERRTLDLYSAEAFHFPSRAWVKTGWGLRYSYGFTWAGRPVIQLPEDLLRVQEVVHEVQPDVIVETGVAHGGSLVFYAGLFAARGSGRVIGVDIEIRPHNRAALEEHPYFERIELVEGDSVDPAVVESVAARIRPGERVLVVLDSCHTRDHVRAELEAYAPLVTPGSYVAVADGIMRELHDVPGGSPAWDRDNPTEAMAAFIAEHPEFEWRDPPVPFNEGEVRERVTYWPRAWLRRR